MLRRIASLSLITLTKKNREWQEHQDFFKKELENKEREQLEREEQEQLQRELENREREQLERKEQEQLRRELE